MRLWEWLFGRKSEPNPPAMTVTVGMSQGEWLEEMLDLLDEKDKRAKRIAYLKGKE